MNGTVFNIQPYSIHDGPGIRTTIFLKGCPLHCLWCQNPESQDFAPQLLYYHDLCAGCGRCIAACPRGAIERDENKVSTNRALCVNCGECVPVCPTKSREITGTTIDAIEAADKACADKIFFDDSGGGVTLSGGEVLSQPEFAAAVLRRCKENGVHTAIETSGFSHWERMLPVLEHTDLVLYDFKHMNPVAHKELTGVDNRIILENAKRIVRELHKPLIGRIPLIPGLNDSEENILATARFISDELRRDIKVHILPYNALGESKKISMEQTNFLQLRRQSDEELYHMRKIMLPCLDNVIIGG